MRKWLSVFLYCCIFTLVLFFGKQERVYAVQQNSDSSLSAIQDGTWINDPNVTFAGKVAARARDFLDWTLKNYEWSSQSGYNTSLATYWITIRNVVYAFFVLVVIITAFVLIVTQGRNVTAILFIRRFILAAVLVTISFSLIQFIYQITDIVQGFFLRKPDGKLISSTDLLSVQFAYNDFIGYRLSGAQYDESISTSLLLIKFTALTHYVMSGIILVRKIILWFFLIISPVIPLLLFYPSIRNTAKAWLVEFLRWLLYAPLLAILLSGLVTLWGGTSGIPLDFKFSNNTMYPTAISILLGGPGQNLSMNNSLNTPDTFALYLVALLMLWIVIILPFLLLQIFLNYVKNTSLTGESTWINRIIKNRPPPIQKQNDQISALKSQQTL